jgi:uncharacterized protein (TIGR02594 family)
MSYPKGYEHLGKIGTLPKMVQEALKLVGTVETPGSGNNPTIMAWAKAAGLGKQGYSADAVPWCGLFMAYVALMAGKPAPKNPLWALNWAGFGTPQHQPCLGDVLTFKRNGGGHVAIYIGEDQTAYHVLGGNQSDAVTITRIDKKRMHSVARAPMQNPPDTVKPYILSSTGALSTNEK